MGDRLVRQPAQIAKYKGASPHSRLREAKVGRGTKEFHPPLDSQEPVTGFLYIPNISRRIDF